MIHGSCLCGAIRWEAPGPWSMMTHCHCSMCRKHHGSAFATFVVTPTDGLTLTAGADEVARYRSSSRITRCFCPYCASKVPDPRPTRDRIFVPAGNLLDDCGARPELQIYCASRAPWYEISDPAPQYPTLPDGWPDPGTIPAPHACDGSAVHGSCLCGAARFEIDGEPMRFANCHCSRCRRSRSAAHASNVFYPAASLNWVAGEDRLSSYKLPEAERFGVSFCRQCGSLLPRVVEAIGAVNVPAGCLDDDPGIRPGMHIYVADAAPWFQIRDQLPQFQAGPPE